MIDVHGIPGHLLDGDVRFLQTLAESLPTDARVAEIGTHFGASAAAMALANPGLRVLCHDTWLDTERSPNMAIFMGHIIRLGLETRVIPVRGDSSHSVTQYRPEHFDAIWIDGDHENPGFRKDLHLWHPLLKEGGIFCGHDCVPGSDIDLETSKFAQWHGMGRSIVEGTHYVWVMK